MQISINIEFNNLLAIYKQNIYKERYIKIRKVGVKMSFKCSNCGKDNKENAKFCSGCGGNLKPTKSATSSSEKSKGKWGVFLVVVAVAVLIFAVFVIRIGNGGGVTGNAVNTVNSAVPNEPKCRDVQVPYETQEAYEKTEYYTESVPYTDNVCDTKKLIYSITNFDVTGGCTDYDERCVDYILGICTEKVKYCIYKSITCSLNLNNLDDENGRWGVKFQLYQESSIADTKTVTPYLYPQTTQIVSYTFTLTGEEKADKTYSCNYQVVDEPTKQVCRDVIKYKDVQRSRQVTAYKPVTKYKTETKCD